MPNARLTETIEREIADKVSSLFDKLGPEAALDRLGFGKSAYSDFQHLDGPTMRQHAIDAACARAWFDPPWWAPRLPLDPAYCAILLKGTPRCRLLVHFTNSLRKQGWNYREHPDFPRYAAAALACPKAPIKIREDYRLMCDYTPKPLPWDAGRAYLGKVLLNDPSVREPTQNAEIISLGERRLQRDEGLSDK